MGSRQASLTRAGDGLKRVVGHAPRYVAVGVTSETIPRLRYPGAGPGGMSTLNIKAYAVAAEILDLSCSNHSWFG